MPEPVAALTVDLSLEPNARWVLSDQQRASARELVLLYLRDMGGAEQFRALVGVLAERHVVGEHLREVQSVAGQVDLPWMDVLTANLSYDLMKSLFACTAFAFDSKDGPVHVRNLDWWTENELLGKETLQTHYRNGRAGNYISIGWPGFNGVLSGVAPGRFAVTLNAVLSERPALVAKPISYFIREVFDRALNYESAYEMLIDQEIACDCLLLLTGAKPGEMAVIERTPDSFTIRPPQDGRLIVTNEYRAMEGGAGSAPGGLRESACGRYDRVAELLARRSPATFQECLEVISDPAVKMAITAQQMAMCAATGDLAVQV